MSRLSEAQRAALHYVEDVARSRSETAQARIDELLRRAGEPAENYRKAMECVREHARVVVHFHPDRVGRHSETVVEGLLRDGRYRNQFETGLSGGSLTARPGGDRDTWERSLFGGAYQAEGTTDAERPKYGALELIRHPDGPIPRFGSCYMVLRPSVAERTSFTFMGSEHPRALERIGVIEHMDCVMAELLQEIGDGGMANPSWPPFRAPTLGVPNLTIPGLLALLRQDLPSPRAASVREDRGRVLDTVIEAHLHGDLELRTDVEVLVADRVFERTPTGGHLKRLAEGCEIPLEWQRGPRLVASDVPDDFRGPEMPPLARHVARGGVIDAATIGAAAASLHRDPASWANWGEPARTRELLKQLWHVVVHYGSALGAEDSRVEE